MKTILIIFSLVLSSRVFAQQVQLIKLDDINKRVRSGKDTVYIINFWATWCVPCLEELPQFEKLSGHYKSNKLKVMLISMDFRSKLENTVVPFVRKKTLKNEVFLFDETNQQEYIDRIDSSWSGALPATLIIHKHKRRFFEKEFTYKELLAEYKNIQKP
ncbi:TlpA disulfide reductase family protein [Flavitalea sp.]|nr:TlpA disulfide reductase family protein [Flavitalea sp.]